MNVLTSKVAYHSKCTKLYFDESIEIPDMPGKILVFECDKISYKYDALNIILKDLLKVQSELFKNKAKTNLPQSSSYLEFMILIPEGLVALVIGAKGKQIKALMDESGAEIIVNQPVYGMNQRSVTIKGQPKEIATAVAKIFETLEDLSY